MALFSFLAELRADISSRGRDAFVSDLVENQGPTYELRNRKILDNDGIIYALIYRANSKIYVGQTINFDARMREHFSYDYDGKCIKNAIKKNGQKKFVSVILLAGIEHSNELD